MTNFEQIERVKNYLKEVNQKSGSPFSSYVFGNAFTGKEVFIGEGEGRVGEPVNDKMYYRWASCTKILGLIILCKAIDDGFIDSIDEPVYKYITEFSNITKYVKDAVPVFDEQGNQLYDKYGTPRYNMVLEYDPELGKKITIRNLINHSSGIGYITWGLASSRKIFVDPIAGTPNGNKYIAYLQYIEQNNVSQRVDIFNSYYFNEQISFTDLILERTKHPLIFFPGNDNIYGEDHNFIAGIVSRALQQKGLNITAAQYCKEKIFIPLGINNSWLLCGSLNPPADVLDRITDAYFVRDSNIDGQGGKNVEFGKLYRCLNPSVSDDGFVRQELGQVVKLNEPTDTMAGGFSESGVGPLTDYVKLLKLIINKGVVKSKCGFFDKEIRVISSQSLEYVLAPKFDFDTNLWTSGKGTIPFLAPYETWSGACTAISEYKGSTLPTSIGNSVYKWIGYYNTTYYFDTKTGNYLFGGTQVSFGSWLLPTSTLPFQPDALKIWQILTA